MSWLLFCPIRHRSNEIRNKTFDTKLVFSIQLCSQSKLFISHLSCCETPKFHYHQSSIELSKFHTQIQFRLRSYSYMSIDERKWHFNIWQVDWEGNPKPAAAAARLYQIESGWRRNFSLELVVSSLRNQILLLSPDNVHRSSSVRLFLLTVNPMEMIHCSVSHRKISMNISLTSVRLLPLQNGNFSVMFRSVDGSFFSFFNIIACVAWNGK